MILIGLLFLFGLLAAMSLVASDLSPPLSWPLAMAAMAYGLHAARCEHRRPPRTLVIAGNPVVCRVDGRIVDSPAVQWRGTIAFVGWLEPTGARDRLVWWPDTLPRHARRELRLAAAMLEPTPRSKSMAP